MKLFQPKRLVHALLIATLCACASPTPELDSKFGQAVSAAKAQQTINPDAANNRDPVAGIDGPAAKELIDRYQTSFRTPPPVADVNSGGSSTGGAR